MSELDFKEGHLFKSALFQPFESFQSFENSMKGLFGGASLDVYSAFSKEQVTSSNIFSNPGIFSMLNGFSIDGGSADSKPAPAKEPRAQCTQGWATVYGPTGNRMADGSRYTGREQAVAVDMDRPVLGAALGHKLVIRNVETGEILPLIVKDKGAFGNPRIYRTPDGRPRLVDLTYGAARRLGAGDMTRVEVCKPIDQFRRES